MKTFSKISKKKLISDEITKDELVSTKNSIEYENSVFTNETDIVVCIIYLIELNKFILNHEYISSFKYAEGQDYHLTVLSNSVKKGETNNRAILREIEEEAGFVIDPDIKIEFLKPLFIYKNSIAKYHPCIISLTENDYQEVIPKKKNDKNKIVKLDIKYVNLVNTSDLITEYMLLLLKKLVNID